MLTENGPKATTRSIRFNHKRLCKIRECKHQNGGERILKDRRGEGAAAVADNVGVQELLNLFFKFYFLGVWVTIRADMDACGVRKQGNMVISGARRGKAMRWEEEVLITMKKMENSRILETIVVEVRSWAEVEVNVVGVVSVTGKPSLVVREGLRRLAGPIIDKDNDGYVVDEATEAHRPPKSETGKRE
ncbi:hypothetical protein L3X38_019482 [Prunus dulcis]|uniref:Uncharacterized protein n=1 Tax=Prunus dulcis TaxID=3755 RepID=A0AAD4ZCM0_PRUDU|nr:hypothetical protein L3X38_019482 [Prunus dulcis]